jgi:seryl-tRNA(Sec) selenium transferase
VGWGVEIYNNKDMTMAYDHKEAKRQARELITKCCSVELTGTQVVPETGLVHHYMTLTVPHIDKAVARVRRGAHWEEVPLYAPSVARAANRRMVREGGGNQTVLGTPAGFG